MTDFLLELASEEIPARMQAGARADLARLFGDRIAAAGLPAPRLTVWSGPRRLSLIAHDLPDATPAVAEERKGPRADAPDAAVAGFLRSTGLTREQCAVRDVKGVPTLFALIARPGRATQDVLAEAIPAIVRAFPWPKSMRWGARSGITTSLRWVRPLTGIVALFGEHLVACEVDGIASGFASPGHRFHHGGVVTIGSAADYAEKLRAVHVIADHEEREALIREGARRAAAEAGLELVEDEGLVVENAGLTEWPVPLLGRFDAAFLEVPPEVIQLTARVNQKYFICREPGGALANAFVCTANIAAKDGGAAIVAGNRKVLAARLSDARFFWEQDRKKPLAEHAARLSNIVFHEKLGTVADKVERVAGLARWLVEEGILAGADPAAAEQAARLAKADLVTDMVGEFPELQGLMGGYYARAEGLPDAVADAIRDHYKPVGQGDAVPTAPVSVALALADKLDTLTCFFAIDEKPTGSKDPFALRRAALAIIRLIETNALRCKLIECILASGYQHYVWKVHNDVEGLAVDVYYGHELKFGSDIPLGEFEKVLQDRLDEDQVFKFKAEYRHVYNQVLTFIADRLKVQQREAGVRHDLIDAVFALGEDDLVRLLARVAALQGFMATEDGANLLAGYRRAANILKKEGFAADQAQDDQGIAQTGEEDPLVLVDDPILGEAVAEWARAGHAPRPADLEPAEAALFDALDAAEPRALAAIEAEDFAGAMAALASLRAPIDRFFEDVTVNAEVAALRDRRLALLARFRAAVHRVADFARIEG